MTITLKQDQIEHVFVWTSLVNFAPSVDFSSALQTLWDRLYISAQQYDHKAIDSLQIV